MRRTVLLSAMAIGLAGCNSSDSTFDYTDASDPFLDGSDAALELNDQFVLPSAGSASYVGEAGIAFDSNASGVAIGDVRLTADFASGDIDGTINNFVLSEDRVTARNGSGSLTIDAEIDILGLIDGDVTGSMELPSGSTADIQADAFGNFLNEDAGATGIPDGAIISFDGETTSGPSAVVEGFLYAQ